jgi:hypothetical protein
MKRMTFFLMALLTAAVIAQGPPIGMAESQALPVRADFEQDSTGSPDLTSASAVILDSADTTLANPTPLPGSTPLPELVEGNIAESEGGVASTSSATGMEPATGDPAPTLIHPPSSESFGPLALPEGKQTVAIYMAGEEPTGARGVHNIMGGELARILSESDSYLAVDRTEAVRQQLAREHVYQRSGAVNDDQIKALGEQLGVQYICISDINAVGKRYYLDTRLVDVVTAEIIRSVTATSTLKDANEMSKVSRNIALELLEAERTREQRLRRKKIFRYTAIGLDILGAGMLAYGYFENNNVVKYVEEHAKEPEAERAATRRNAAYIVGGSLLLGGITIHILF